MRRIGILLVLLCMMFCNFAYAKADKNELTTNELKALQTKTYNNVSSDKVMKAIINVLQDKCYFIENADTRIGFILAAREFDNTNKSVNVKEEFGCYKLSSKIRRYSTSRTEADINITPSNNNTIVRIIFRKKIINLYNAGNKVRDLQDPAYYSTFFDSLSEELNSK